MSNAVRNILTNKKERVISIIQQGQEESSIRKDVDSSMLATVFMGGMRFTILQWRLSNYSFDLTKEGKELWDSYSLLLGNK